MTKRNTRIICTMGPTTESVDVIRALIRKGMNIARFNFSHGSRDYHKKAFERVREASALEGIPVSLLLDTQGPEIRTGFIKDDGTITITPGEKIDVIAESDSRKIYGEDGAFTQNDRITVTYDEMADDVIPGAKIFIADGLAELDVISLDDRIIHCKVISGGTLGSRKNVNIVGVHTKLPALSEKDKEDILFGHKEGIDYIAASFIRKASDVTTIQRYIKDIGSDIPVIAKIEDEEGLENIDEIVRVSAGVMVARGDLGVQIPVEKVPIEQKRIIDLCNREGKPVITATQMLDSMIHNPRPTRAEAGDVANAVLDGTDCVMLSGETANGKFPEAAVECMDKIARAAEASGEYVVNLAEKRRALQNQNDSDLSHVIAHSASFTADKIDAACLVIPTLSGHTAQLVSKHRPLRRIIAATPSEVVQRRLLLYCGVIPVLVNKKDDSEAMVQGAISAAIQKGFACPGDKVVVVAGLPVNSPLTANSIRVHIIGNVLGQGTRSFGGRCTGRIIKAENVQEAAQLLKNHGGEILLTHTLDDSFIPILRIIDGIILEGASGLTYKMIKTINPNIVYISQVRNAMKQFEEHIIVTLDGKEKMIYEGALE
jgi:pyruvate kinase